MNNLLYSSSFQSLGLTGPDFLDPSTINLYHQITEDVKINWNSQLENDIIILIHTKMTFTRDRQSLPFTTGQ